MSVFVSDFSATPWTVIDDAAGHSGTIDPATIQHPANMDGSPDHNFLVVTCPVCQAASTHPVGGGAQPPLVQELFIHLSKREGCPCPEGSTRSARTTPDSSNQAHHDHVKEHAEAMDFEGRWQVTPEQLAESGIPLN